MALDILLQMAWMLITTVIFYLSRQSQNQDLFAKMLNEIYGIIDFDSEEI